jgi:choline monooxygenase
VDREALERILVRRLLDHIELDTTDLADSVLEVPAATFASPDRLAEERGVLFLGQPLVLCLSGALPGPGSYRTVDLCETPILLTRDANGRVRALANICRHRGVRVVDGAGEARRFTCPFHAWVYDLEGRLAGVPVAGGFAGMPREEKSLVELPVAEGCGLILGRLRPGPPVDVASYLGPVLADELATLDFADWELHREPHVHLVNANWKVALDTFRENYHLNYLHRKTLADYNYGGILAFDAFGPHLRNCSAVRSIDQIRGRPEVEWGPLTPYFACQYGLFPNIVLSIDRRHIEFWQILPKDVDVSEVVHTAYMRPDLPESERESLAEFTAWVCETVVDGEDFWVAGRTEPGIRTGLTSTVTFGRNEPGSQHMHQAFAAALAEAAPP